MNAELAPLYAFLSRLFALEIDRAWVSEIPAEAAALLDRLEPGTAAWLADFDDEVQESCAEEYARLFILPKGISLRAAAWLPGELATVGAEVSRWTQHYLDVLHLEVMAGPYGRLPLDHISLLLHLAGTADEAVGEELIERQIAPLVGRFGQRLAEHAQSPLYRAAGTLLQTLHPAPPSQKRLAIVSNEPPASSDPHIAKEAHA